MTATDMTVEVESVPATGLDARWLCSAATLDLADEIRVCGDGEVSARLARNGTEVHVVGEVKIRLGFECSRCMEPFEQDLAAPINVMYVRGEAGDSEWRLDPDEDPDVNLAWYSESRINLAPDVRDAVALGVPMAAVCQNECKGLCVQCGANLNMAPCECPVAEPESPFAGLNDLKAQLLDNERARKKDS